jgi:biotin carboxylase
MKVLLIGSHVSYQHVDSDKLISLGVYPYFLYEGPIPQQKSSRNALFIKNLKLSEVRKVVEENKIDSLVCFNDNFLIETAKIRTELNLPGIGYPEILKFKNKVEMNKALRGKIKTINTILFSGSTEYDDILKKLGGDPYFIKPDSRAGAEDTFVVQNKEGYLRFKKIIVDKYGQGIIQPYIEAELYHSELYVSEGIPLYKSARKYSYPNHKILKGKIIASLPIKDPDIKQELETASVCVQKGLGFRNGVMHTEFFWVNGKPIFLETNIRQAGGSINLIHGKTTGTSMEMAMILLET